MKVRCRHTTALCTRPAAPGSEFCRCATKSPATTIAKMPDPWAASAAIYTRKGATIISEFAGTRSWLCRRSRPIIHPLNSPTPTPTKTASEKSMATSPTVIDPAIAATIATFSAVRPVPSLTKLSPSRIDTSRRGSDALLAMVPTETASVGASTAPSAIATAMGSAATQ